MDFVTTETSRRSASGASRRGLFRLPFYGGLSALATKAVARADEPANTQARMGPTLADRVVPVVDARFPAEMAPGVFVLPDKRIPLVPNVGIIVGRDTVLVVDCGLGPESGENVRSCVGARRASRPAAAAPR